MRSNTASLNDRLVLVWYTMQCVTILANDYSSDGDKLCESQQLCMQAS